MYESSFPDESACYYVNTSFGLLVNGWRQS